MNDNDFHNLYSAPSNSSVSLKRHVAHTGEMHTKLQSENLNGTDHSEDLSADGRIILKWTLKKSNVTV